ncbi:hypothetical protein FisN_2Lu070 [Fistulifera solaris]|uniref:Uncharacterized protein n=1 Tax=Fistulifera solaris TaxID=1519565 RepID=A0A1Z5JWJ3_FISSO|nr:hypothetical protein FisN_2Lu070 [Fistulifera solaris]|eukprot:GAX18415.1 hypothetical protein FisN_2Lu070 [Fistulifera solaris]
MPVVSPMATDSSSSSLTLKTIVQNIYHRRTAPSNNKTNNNNNKSLERLFKEGEGKEEERHDIPIQDSDLSEPLPTTDEDHEEAEQREPMVIKTHRRTSATDWNELVQRAQNTHKQHHRRTLAMTNDEFMDVTMVCDELHGSSLCVV